MCDIIFITAMKSHTSCDETLWSFKKDLLQVLQSDSCEYAKKKFIFPHCNRDSPVYYLCCKSSHFPWCPYSWRHISAWLRFRAGCTHSPDIHFLSTRRSSQITQWRFSLLLLFFSGERRLAKAIACTTVSPSVNCVPEQTWFCPLLLNLKKWKLDLCCSAAWKQFSMNRSLKYTHTKRINVAVTLWLHRMCTFCARASLVSIYFAILSNLQMDSVPVLYSELGFVWILCDTWQVKDLRVSLIHCLSSCFWL